MSKWAEMFGASDSPYEFPLGLEVGAKYKVPPPFPDAEVKAVFERYPRRIVVQQVDLEASADEMDKREDIRVFVVVLETEDGQQIELNRWAAPAAELDKPVVDISTCHGCGGKIPEGQARVIGGKAYHGRCVQEDSDEDRAIRAARNRNHGADRGVGGGRVEERTKEDEKDDGTSPTAAPKTVSKTRLQGKSPSHMVTIAKLGDDMYLTTLWAREHDGLSGTANGRWSTGLFNGEIPRDSDVSYVDEKFFKGAGVTTKSDLRVWNRLYTEAFKEIEPPF